jgi:serine protease AprX
MNIYPLFKKKLEDQPNIQFRIIISFIDNLTRDKFIKKYVDLKILKKFNFIPSVYVDLTKDQILDLEKDELIKQIEEDQKLHFAMLDVMEILELDEYQYSHISFKGSNITVGIIDDGINKDFPALSNTQHFFDLGKNSNKLKIREKEISHGTIMAGIIGNQFKNADNECIGVAPNVNLIDFKLDNSKPEYFFSDILRIFEKILKDKIGIDILLISLTTIEPSDGKDILSVACNLLVDSGLIIVTPAGNYGPKKYSIGSPGVAEKVITIGALTKDLIIPDYSGRGPTLDDRMKPDLCLPGSNVTIPLSNNLRINVTGTSVSASIGVGLIALIKEFDPKITYKEIMDLFSKSSLDLNYEQTSQGLGTVKVTDLFNELDLLHEKLVPYNYLIKKSITISIEILILLLFLFYLFYFFRVY